MKEFIIGIILGIIIWQLMCFIFFFMTKEDYYKTAEFSLGIPGIILWVTSLIMRKVHKIYIKSVYSKIIHYTEYYWRDELGNEKYNRTSIHRIYIKKWDLKKYKVGKIFKVTSTITDENLYDSNIKYSWLEFVKSKDNFCYEFLHEIPMWKLVDINENFSKLEWVNKI